MILGGIALLVILYGQAITAILFRNYAGGMNYYGMPVGPLLQLVVAVACTVLVPIVIWRESRKRGKAKHESTAPQWMKEFPFKLPWGRKGKREVNGD